ncbi:MAG: hypothetical protein DRR42_13745 [Gammaproteobacteria bacterium]|nr:MAG: hypothetical protein DRR42_13745 [Gammaproteobacteria bacterium]
MRRLKTIFIFLSIAFIACTAIVAILLMVLDDEDYSEILSWTVEHYTDYKISINGPLSVDWSLMPALTMADVSIETDQQSTPQQEAPQQEAQQKSTPQQEAQQKSTPQQEASQQNAQPVLAHIGQFKIKLDIKTLLFRTILIKELQVEDAVISVSGGGSISSSSKREVIKNYLHDDINIPIFESVTLKNINVNYADLTTDITHKLNITSFTIDDVRGDLRDDDPLQVAAQGTMNNAQWSIVGELGSLTDAVDLTNPYPVNLDLKVADSSFIVSGTIADPVDVDGLNINISTKKTDLTNLLAVPGLDIQGLGFISFDGTLTGSVEAPGITDFRVNIAGSSNVEFSANGRVENLLNGAGADITISGKSSNRDLLVILQPQVQYPLTDLIFAGRLYDRRGDYALEDMNYYAQNEIGTIFKAKGNVLFGGSLTTPEYKNMDLRVGLDAKDTTPLKRLISNGVPSVGPVSAEARLVGTEKHFIVEDLKLTVGVKDSNKHPVWFSAHGRVGEIPLEPGSTISGIDLSLSLETSDPALLLAGFDVSMPEVETISTRTQIRGSADQLIFDELEIHMTDSEGVVVHASGSAGTEQVANSASVGSKEPVNKEAESKEAESKETVFKYDLDVDIAGPKMMSFQRLLLSTTLPDLGPVHGTAHVTGTAEHISIKDLSLRAGDAGPVRLGLSGDLDKIVFDGTELISGANIIGSIFADNSSLLSEYLLLSDYKGTAIPDLGPVEGKFLFVTRDEGYGLDNIEILIGQKEDLRLSAKGNIEYVVRDANAIVEGMAADIKMNEFDWQVIADFVHPEIPDLGIINGSFSLSGSSSDWTVTGADLSSVSATGLEVTARGDIKYVKGDSVWAADGMDIKLSARAPDDTVIDAFLDLDIPLKGPLAIDGLLKGGTNNLSLKGDVTIGETQFHLSVEQNHKNNKPDIVAAITATEIHLVNLGIQPKTLADGSTPSEDRMSRKDTPIFSDEPLPFGFLKDVELSLTIDVAELVGDNYTLKDLDIDASSKNGVLKINPAKLSYADGFISVEATVDISKSEPEITLKMIAQDVDIGTLLAHVPTTPFLGGHLNLVVDLNSAGSSAHKIASSLNGEIGATIEDGKIKEVADLLGADAVDFVTTVLSPGKYENLNCLAIVVSFAEGTGTSKTMVMATDKYLTRGMGTVNLGNETIDIGLHPKSARRKLTKSSPVQIKGSLRNPSVRKLPGAEAVELYGTIFLPFVFLPARALGMIWHKMSEDESKSTSCKGLVAGDEAPTKATTFD